MRKHYIPIKYRKKKETLNTLFKSRIGKEDNSFLYKLANKRIKMMDNKRTEQSVNDKWMISACPHWRSVSPSTLEEKMRLIFSMYYKWMYGSSYWKLKDRQLQFQGVLEIQRDRCYHTHFIVECDLATIRIFYGFFSRVFKFFYPSSSFRCIQVYDTKDMKIAKNYCSVESDKDKLESKKRLEAPIYISDKTFQNIPDTTQIFGEEFIGFIDYFDK